MATARSSIIRTQKDMAMRPRLKTAKNHSKPDIKASCMWCGDQIEQKKNIVKGSVLRNRRGVSFVHRCIRVVAVRDDWAKLDS